MKHPAHPIGTKLFLNQGKGVPMWLDSFACYVVGYGTKNYHVRIPVDDDRIRSIKPGQLTTFDPWTK